MFKQKLPLIFSILCAFHIAASRPTTENPPNVTKAALVVPPFKPDVELFDVRSVPQPDEDAYRRAAASNGMDPSIVAEVIKHKKPVVKTEYDENGAKRTTTYKLEADGSISRHTLTEYRPTVEKVHKTTLVTNPKANAESNVESDWEWNPSSVSKFGSARPHTFDFPQYTPTWTTPVFTNERPFGSRPFEPSRPSLDGTPTVKLPETWNTNLWPNTKTFEHVDPTSSGTETKTVINDDGTKVTTTHTVGPTKWTTRTYTYPAVSTFPKIDIQTTTPFPSLQDFLNSQYGTTTKRPFTSTIPSLVPGSTPVTTISVDDLPAVRVPLHELKPEDNVPFSSTPNIQTTKTYTKTIQTHGDPTAADLDPKMREILRDAGITPEELFNSKNNTITKTRRDPDGHIVTTTYRVRTVPNSAEHGNNSPNFGTPSFKSTFDLDKPFGPFPIADSTTPPPFTHVSSSHSGAHFPTASGAPETPHHSFTPNSIFKHSWHPDTFEPEPKPEPKPVIPKNATNPIEEFLAKIGLSPETIEAANGEVIKTIVDDKGRVLTARFVLSTVKNENYSLQAKQNPIK